MKEEESPATVYVVVAHSFSDFDGSFVTAYTTLDMAKRRADKIHRAFITTGVGACHPEVHECVLNSDKMLRPIYKSINMEDL